MFLIVNRSLFVIKIKEFLTKNNIEFIENFDVSLVSSIKLGEKIKIAIFPKKVNEFEKVLMFLNSLKIYFKVLGNASNVLVAGNVNYPIVFTNKMMDEIEIKNNWVTVSAGILLSRFCDVLKKNNLSGYEGLIGIPATVGGAIYNNAGAFGYSISDHLVKISVFEKGKIFDVYKNEIKFGYHFSNLSGFVVLTATFLFENKNEYDIINLCNEFTYLRNKNQPNGLSLGSVYSKANGKSAGFFIERAGLKGTRIGGVVVSNKHSNFFINDKFGTALDFLRLSALVEATVESQFGVKLVPEIEKVGDKDEIIGRLPCSF